MEYSIEYGRSGIVKGLFIAREDEIDNFLVGQTIDFGEILGKHSEVSIDFKKDDFECLSISKEAVLELLNALNRRSISGYFLFNIST